LASVLTHVEELMAIATDVGDFVRDDEMLLRIDRNLHVVADNPNVLCRSLPLSGRRDR
jgi:uncharacterized membrane protein